MERADRRFDELFEAWREAPPGLRRWQLRHMVGRVASTMPRAAFGPARERAMRTLSLDLPNARAVPGTVAFPAIGGSSTFVRAHVEVCDDDDLPDLPGDTRRAVTAALEAVRREQRVAVRFRVRLEGEIEGTSCGLAVALAAVSAARRDAIGDVVATGEVSADGAVLPVGRLPEKLRLRSEARPRARMLVPHQDHQADDQVVPVRTLAEAVDRAFAPVDTATRMSDALTADREGHWELAAAIALELWDHADVSDDERAVLALYRVVAANHRGGHGLEEPLARLEALASRVSAELVAKAWGIRAVALVDAFDVAAAETLLGQAPKVERRNEVHLLGPRALVAILRGQFHDAVALRTSALEVADRRERPRCLADLSDGLLRAGDLAGSVVAARDALAAMNDLRRDRVYLTSTRRFVRLHLARALAAAGDVAAARHELDAVTDAPSPDPAMRIELERALLDRDMAAVDRAWERQRASQAYPVLEALHQRARAVLGDARADERLATLMGMPRVSGPALYARLPY